MVNPKVYLLENNDRPQDWYYYNAMKNDKDNPNRAKVYEAYLKLILAGAAIKGDEYPHKIEIPDYSYSYMSEDDLDKANWAFRYDHPEFFYVFWKYSDKRYWKSGDNIVYEGGSGGRLVTNNGKVYLVFDGVYESIEALQADEAAVLAGAQKKLDSFIAEFGNPKASATKTAEETKTMFNNLASFFHKKVYYITRYNHKGRQTAYGTFTDYGGVCEGLSLAFQYFVLLSKIGC